MNRRLQQFLSAENITQSQFADKIGVAKASVSHILSGRNKPGFEFIESMANCYPNLNLDWLIGGKGRMYKGQETGGTMTETGENGLSKVNDKGSGQLFDSHEADLFQETAETTDNEPQTEPVSPVVRQPVKPGITKILIFYDNGTFKEID